MKLQNKHIKSKSLVEGAHSSSMFSQAKWYARKKLSKYTKALVKIPKSDSKPEL